NRTVDIPTINIALVVIRLFRLCLSLARTSTLLGGLLGSCRLLSGGFLGWRFLCCCLFGCLLLLFSIIFLFLFFSILILLTVLTLLFLLGLGCFDIFFHAIQNILVERSIVVLDER